MLTVTWKRTSCYNSLTECLEIFDIVMKAIKLSNVQNQMRLRMYNAIATHVLMHGSDHRTVRQQNKP